MLTRFQRTAISVVMLLSAACASAPARSTSPPLPVIGTGTVSIALQPPIGGVTVHVGPISCLTNGDGVAVCEPVPAGEYVLTFDVASDGYELADGNDQITINVSANQAVEAHAVFRRTAIVAHERGFVHICGRDFPARHDFCDEGGAPWLFAGKASYTIISEIAKGHDIGWFFDEAIGEGANTVVALGMDGGNWAQSHGFYLDPRDPNWSAWVASLFDAAAAHHARVYFAVFQQAQILSDAEQRAIWQRACDVARGRWNVLLAEGNEDDVNNWHHESLPRCNGDMGGVLVSTGSRGINNPPTPPNFDFAVWEGRRDPFPKAIDDAGAGAWEMYAGYPGFPAVPMPIVAIEPPFFYESEHDMYGDFRWFEPWKALRLGLSIGANFAGGTFGSSQSLETKPDGPIAEACAREFFHGLRAAFQR